MQYTLISLDTNNCLVNIRKSLNHLISNKIRLLVFSYFLKKYNIVLDYLNNIVIFAQIINE